MASRIRVVVPSDDEELTELQVRNRDFLAPWDPLREDDYFTVAGQRADIEGALARHVRGEAMPWVVMDDDGAIAGRLTLTGIVRGPFQSCSMGYWLAEDQTRKGLATDAVRAAVGFAFNQLKLHRVQAETLVDNVASQRVLTKTDFEQYGRAPRYLRIAGRWQDHLMFQRLNDSVQSPS
ncbi:GNAT family N-acetyltransferase [Arthrobacter burdickii]|uniref:GNAT family N-acetyltransferase n=1 Tax=Arthrobacter burdickii TaxID=3035920 RepID=A0ABT8K0E2_9MICC|nr:GNAT family N-acetyltransferase [Arthrobacter burdickii]MDN4610896.1 GNAT family N-acetyltransferase [Arthrobacter burdickii]